MTVCLFDAYLIGLDCTSHWGHFNQWIIDILLFYCHLKNNMPQLRHNVMVWGQAFTAGSRYQQLIPDLELSRIGTLVIYSLLGLGHMFSYHGPIIPPMPSGIISMSSSFRLLWGLNPGLVVFYQAAALPCIWCYRNTQEGHFQQIQYMFNLFVKGTMCRIKWHLLAEMEYNIHKYVFISV